MKTFLLLLCLTVFSTFAFAQKIPAINCDDGLDFKYLIVSDFLSKGFKSGPPSREVWVFMDPSAFSEANLKLMFEYLSKKYSKPTSLNIWVQTDWKYVPKQGDCEGDADSGNHDDPDVDRFHWAVYMRQGIDEIYRYNPVLGRSSTKTVVLKGNAF